MVFTELQTAALTLSEKYETILVLILVRENLWVTERSQSNLPASDRVFLHFKALPIPQVKGITP